jgi:sugar lactone lactonase YvrE
MRLLMTALILGFVLQLSAQAEDKVIHVGKQPESVCRGFGGKLYVTIINDDQPGDGGINAVDGDQVQEFCRGMNSPKGIAFVGEFLVVADETTVWKVDRQGKAEVLVDKDDFPNTIEFLNDVSVAIDGESVYVSEMSDPKWMFDPSGERQLWEVGSPEATCPQTGCIYQVSLDGKVTVAVPAGGELTGPNGVTVRGKGERATIVMGDFFTGQILSYNGKKMRVLADGMRGADGVVFGNGVMYVTSWPLGKVWKVDLKTQEKTLLSEQFTTAADCFLDRKNHQLIVPDMVRGTLTFIPVK